MRSNAAPPETRSCDTCGGGRAASPTPALPLAQTGQQAPLSVQTFWPFAPGTSPCVHHLAVHLWPLYETTAPPVYTAEALHAGAVHVPPPGGVVGGVVGGGVTGGVAPAKRALNLVNSQSVCATLLQVPKVRPGSGPSGHWRSRLTDQFVYRARWSEVA